MSKQPRCPECPHVAHEDLCTRKNCECVRPGLEAPACPSPDEPCNCGKPENVPMDESPPVDLFDKYVPEGDIPIGGHLLPDKSGPGMHVHRIEHGEILKIPYDEANAEALRNEFRILDLMEGSGFTPEPFEIDLLARTTQADVGVTDDHPHDGEKFRRNMIQALWALRSRGIRHGDLTSANIILRDDWPWLIDFAEAHLIGEKAPQKNPMSDTHLVLRTLMGWEDDTNVADTPRIARRWGAVMKDAAGSADLDLPLKGKRFLDLGCFQGDFVALAACEGMLAYGVDAGGFRTGENSIEIARGLWDFMGDAKAPGASSGAHFSQAEIMNLHDFTHDIVLMFSTWSYMVKDYGIAAAADKLQEVVQDCGTLYFENQLHGDGPGPDAFGTDDDIETFLRSEMVGAREVRKIATFPVWGRPASRTVWAVQS